MKQKSESESHSVMLDSASPWTIQARILKWVAFPFSRGSSQPRDRIQVSRIAGRFFSSWVPREAQEYWSLSLLQRIFLTQELNRGFLHCRWILYQLNHKGNLLEWIAYPFSRGSSPPRNPTRVLCIAGDSLPAELTRKPLITHDK